MAEQHGTALIPAEPSALITREPEVIEEQPYAQKEPPAWRYNEETIVEEEEPVIEKTSREKRKQSRKAGRVDRAIVGTKSPSFKQKVGRVSSSIGHGSKAFGSSIGKTSKAFGTGFREKAGRVDKEKWGKRAGVAAGYSLVGAKKGGKGIGRVIGGTARLAGEGLIGVGEGLAQEGRKADIKRLGRAGARGGVGATRLGMRGLYETGKFISGVELRPPTGSLSGQRGYVGARRPYSKLPIQTQTQLFEVTKQVYPEVARKIFYEGIDYSEFAGSLRNHFPEIYEEVIGYLAQKGMATSGRPTTGFDI